MVYHICFIAVNEHQRCVSFVLTMKIHCKLKAILFANCLVIQLLCTSFVSHCRTKGFFVSGISQHEKIAPASRFPECNINNWDDSGVSDKFITLCLAVLIAFCWMTFAIVKVVLEVLGISWERIILEIASLQQVLALCNAVILEKFGSFQHENLVPFTKFGSFQHQKL